MNYYYSPAHLYKIIPREGEPYYHTLWVYNDNDSKDFYREHLADDITYMGVAQLTIVQPWYEPFCAMWRTFKYWVRGQK